LVALLAFNSGSLLSHAYERTDKLSLRYNLWKIGLWPAPHHLAGSLMSDNQGSYIKGMSKEEVRALFPGAHGGGWLHDYELQYKRDIRGREHLWLDRGDIIVFFENGRVTSMSLMKG